MATEMATPRAGGQAVRPRRRQSGTGGIYWSDTDQLWRGSFEAGWTDRGTRRRIVVSCSTPGPAGRAECARRLERKLNAFRRTGAVDRGTSRATVKSWSDVWLANRVRTQRPKSYATDKSAVTKWIVPTIGRKRLEALTPSDVRGVGEAMRSAGCTSSTERRAHIVLIKMLKDAILDGHEVSNRLLLMKPPAPSAHDRTAIDVDDARALLQVAAEQPDGSRWLAKLLQGLRQGEILGLTWPMINFSDQWIDVSWQLQALNYQHGCRRDGSRWECGRRFGGDCPTRSLRVPDGYEYRQLDGALCLVRPKTAKGQRIVPMVPWMASALQSWRSAAPASPHNLVWPRPGGRPLTARSDTAAWNALQDKADVVGPGRAYYGHEARHTTATLLLEAGVDPKVVQAILGHNSVATSRIYQHVSRDMARQALDALVQRLKLS
jgi:integrase